MKILAIDDNRDNLTILLAILKDAMPECALVTALNGPAGIALARSEDPDVILLDIIMPGMDGFEVCQRLKADEALRTIPVLFLTAIRTDRESRIKALAAGAEAFLNKPPDEQELTALIRAMVKIKAANQQQRQEQERLAALVAERTRELQQELLERKRSESALRESEEKFKHIFDYSVSGISTTLPSGEIHVNRALAAMLGYSREELQYKKWQDLTHPDDIEGTQLIIQSLLAGEKDSARFSKRYLHKDGSVVWADVGSSLRRDKEGKPQYFITTINDLTERRKAEEERRLFTEELARSNIDLQQFAYVASHDLQEPLRMISSYLQLIERRYKHRLDDDADIFIHYAVDGANRLQTLISGLLEFSRIKTHGKTFTQVDTGAVLDGVCRNLEPLIVESGATIHFTGLPVIQADESQIARLFQNLLQNALKFRREGIKPTVTITAETTGGQHVFCVQDNGIGIEQQYFERIFTIFQRLHTREQYPGTGIGLSICKRIVERHCGTIWLESTPGAGASFYFSMPGALQ